MNENGDTKLSKMISPNRIMNNFSKQVPVFPMKIHFKPDKFNSSVSHQKRKFSVLCRKGYKSFNFEVHVCIVVLQRKLPHWKCDRFTNR